MNKVERVKIADLKRFPGNPRRGDITAIAASLREHGQYKPLLVQKSTGYVLIGNNTMEAAGGKLGWNELNVIYADVDDDKARRILLADNRTSDRAGYDDGELAGMLATLDGEYAGVWEADDAEARVAALLAAVTDEDFEESFIELTELPATGAAYAEAPYQEAARAERQAAQIPRQAAGMREIFLVYSEDEHQEVTELLTRLRAAWGEDARAPQVILRLLREAAAAL